jgi:hypothetical protein
MSAYGVVYRTYSTCIGGIDALRSKCRRFDRVPKGRIETGVWWCPPRRQA